MASCAYIRTLIMMAICTSKMNAARMRLDTRSFGHQ